MGTFLNSLNIKGFSFPICKTSQSTRKCELFYVQVESHIGSELTYVLNETNSPIFESMLGDLETQSQSLGVLSYGISLTTLEEVFMK